VGQNVIEASWEALSDAYLYGLLHAEAVDPAEDLDRLERV
jgi:2-isopropylmalate synthase